VDPDAPARLAGDVAFRDWPLVVLTDEPARAAASSMNFLWTTFTRFEPAADIHAAERRIVRNHIAYSAPIVIDARLKPGFPRELSCDEETARTVTRRWKEYFPSTNVEMGDSEKADLD
jgi:3-polyprenyl-4-hydroxybenzoate decarboxylase